MKCVCTGETDPNESDGNGWSTAEDRPAERTLARRELLVESRRPTHVGALRT
jgi:hypothetical protein